jgi:DNA-binding CsgD family transcriptional regulator
MYAEQLALAREAGDPRSAAVALHALGAVAVNRGRYDEATPLIEEALAAYGPLGEEFAANICRYLLGIAAYGRGAFAAAAAEVEAALADRRARGDTIGLAVALDALALLRCELGDGAGAAALLAEALPRWRAAENKEGLAEWLAAAARLAACRGEDEPAARLYGAAEALGDRLGTPLLVPPFAQYRRVVDALRARLGEAAFAAAWAAGRALPPEPAVEEALAVVAGPAAGAPSATEPPLGAPLTARELAVLRLVAEGRSDREIADRLGLSYRTVTSYVRDILTKLDLPSRTAAATFAVRRGLA